MESNSDGESTERCFACATDRTTPSDVKTLRASKGPDTSRSSQSSRSPVTIVRIVRIVTIVRIEKSLQAAGHRGSFGLWWVEQGSALLARWAVQLRATRLESAAESY